MKTSKETSAKIKFRTLGLATLSGVVWLLGLPIWEITQGNLPPEHYVYLLLSISMLLVSISSIFVIKYKEMPRPGGLPSMTGWWAVLVGILVLLMSGIGFFLALYEVAIRVSMIKLYL